MYRYTRWCAGALVFLGAAVCGALWAYPMLAFHTDIASLDEAQLSALIVKEGPQDAYAVLKARVAQASPAAQHDAAHMFGRVLYAAEGISGIAVCDAGMTYGCFHELISRAIREHGMSKAASLNAVCIQFANPAMVRACQHGLGHGLLSFLGYEEKDLLAVLGLCAGYGKTYEGVRGCGGGAFMEFNMRTMLDGAVRPIDMHNEAYPCTVLPARYRNGCFYWQPQWWLARAAGAGTAEMDAFHEAAVMCRTHTSTEEEAQLCLAGLGKLIEAAYDRDHARTLAACTEITTTAADALSCGLRVLTSARQRMEHSVSLCVQYAGEFKTFCEAYLTGGDAAIQAYRTPGAPFTVSEELLHQE